MVWGPATGPFFSKNKSFEIRVYVDGKAGNQQSRKWAGNNPALPMETFTLGRASEPHNIDAFVDELRISDVKRYTGDFTPQTRLAETQLDEHTRALFHFNGNVKGESCGHAGDVPARLAK